MDKETEKRILYAHLAALAREAEPNRYFSVEDIFDHIKKSYEGMGIFIGRNKKGYVMGRLDEGLDLREEIPGSKTCRPNLEELTEEGKVEIVLAAHMKFYRPVLDSD